MNTVTIDDAYRTVVVTEGVGDVTIVTAPSPAVLIETTALGPQGPGGVLPLLGTFVDTTDQPLVTTSASQAVTINTTLETRGVTISNGSRINFQYGGTYRIFAALQIINTTNTVVETNVYFKQNGITLANSNKRVDIPERKSVSTPYHGSFVIELQLTVTALSYIEIHWVADHLGLSLETIPVNGTHPQSPCVRVNVSQAMYAQA